MSNHPATGARPADILSIRSSASFRLQVIKMLGVLLLFIVTYLLLLLASVLLAVGCAWAGIYFFKLCHDNQLSQDFFAILLALAITTPGLMQVAFLLKFLFSRHKPENVLQIEITEKEQPELFAFIKQLTKITRNRFPRRVFLLENVNAAVFYEPGIFNLLAGRKNIQIGLGLVNVLNISEFSTVLTHEFGHFSQRSSQLGIYVATANKIIYNMLYENDGWNNTLEWLSRRTGLMLVIARLSVTIATGVQHILERLFKLVNQQYIRLSREMEFHADAIAVAINGTSTSISTLRRADAGALGYHSCLQQLQQMQKRLRNVYAGQSLMIKDHALAQGQQLDETGLPITTGAYEEIKSRVQLRNQWDTHPTRAEREARFISANIPAAVITASAWTLFSQPEQLQEQLSEQIYHKMFEDAPPYYTLEEFAAAVYKGRAAYTFPTVFNHYYDGRQFPSLPADLTPLSEEQMKELSFENFYTTAAARRFRLYYRDLADADTLRAISTGKLQTRFFELDGQQHPASEAGALLTLLEAVIQQEAATMQEHDNLAFRYHYTKSPAILEPYKQILEHQQRSTRLHESFSSVMQVMSMLFDSKGMKMEHVSPYFETLVKESARIRELLAEIPDHYTHWPDGLAEEVEAFLHNHYTYIQGNEMLENELQTLYNIATQSWEQYVAEIVQLQQKWLKQVAAL